MQTSILQYGNAISQKIQTTSFRVTGNLGGSDGYGYQGGFGSGGGGGASAVSLSNLASEAAIWGKGIPISWGLRKLRGYMLQCTAVRQEVAYTDVNYQQNLNNGYYNYTITRTYKYVCDYAFALGYPGDGGQPKTVLRIWVGDQLIYQNASGNTKNQGVNFYPGSPTQNPDPVLKAVTPDQLAYRGLMYGVLTGFDATITAGQIPDVFVEVADNANVSMTRTVKDQSTHATSFRLETTLYDSREGFLYTIGTMVDLVNVLGAAKFDSTTGAWLSSVPLWNLNVTSGGFNGFDSATTCGFVGDGPQDKYMIGQGGTSNCKPISMINLETGEVVKSIGINFNFPNVDADIYGQWTYSQTMKFVQPQRTRGFIFGYSTLFGADAALLKCYDSNAGGPILKRLAHPGVFSGTGSVCPGHIDDAGNLYFYFMHGTAVDRYQISPADVVTSIPNWYTAPTTLIGGLRAVDGNPVFFMDNGSGTTRIQKVDQNNSATVLWDISGNPSVPTAKGLQHILRGEYAGKEVYWTTGTSGGTVRRLDLMSGQLDSTTDTSGQTWSTVTNPPIWDAIGGNFIQVSTPSFILVKARSYNGTRINLSDFLQQLCVYCGYNVGDISISGISEQITGAIITPPFSLRDVLTNIGAVFNFEVFEADGKITIKRRGRGGSFAIDKTIPEADRALIQEGGSDDVYDTLQTGRSSDDDLPATITLTYIDPNYDYNPVTYTWKRPDGVSKSTGTAAYAVPIIMTESEAGALVSQMLFDIFNGRMKHEFRLGTKYLQLAPGDIVKLVSNSGYTDTVKIEQVTVNADFSQSYVASAISSDSGPAYNPDPFVYTQAPDLNATTKGYVVALDTPYFPWALNRTDQLETFLMGMPAERGTWYGGIVYRTDDNVNYGAINAVDRSPTYGRANFVFPTDTSPNSIHIGQTFKLTLTSGAVTDFVAAASDDVLLTDPTNNLLFYGAPGRWEIMAFSTVVQDAPNRTVTLGNFIRGLYGTDVNVNNHQIGDMMILYSPRLIVSDKASLTDLNKVFSYKIAGSMYPLAYSPAVQITFQGNSDRPWAPANVRAVKSGSDINLTWDWRDRSETTIHDSDGIVTLQGNDLDVYDIEIYSGSTLKRTVTNNAGPAYTYLSADIATDGFTFSTLTQLRVIVYQKSSTLGRGFGRDVTVDVQ